MSSTAGQDPNNKRHLVLPLSSNNNAVGSNAVSYIGRVLSVALPIGMVAATSLEIAGPITQTEGVLTSAASVLDDGQGNASLGGNLAAVSGEFSGGVSVQGVRVQRQGDPVYAGSNPIQTNGSVMGGTVAGTTATFSFATVGGLPVQQQGTAVDAGANSIRTTGTVSASSFVGGSGSFTTTLSLDGVVVQRQGDAVNAGANTIQTTGLLSGGTVQGAAGSFTNSATVGGVLVQRQGDPVNSGTNTIQNTGMANFGSTTVASLSAGAAQVTGTFTVFGHGVSYQNPSNGTIAQLVNTNGAVNTVITFPNESGQLALAGDSVSTSGPISAGALIAGTGLFTGMLTVQGAGLTGSMITAVTGTFTGGLFVGGTGVFSGPVWAQGAVSTLPPSSSAVVLGSYQNVPSIWGASAGALSSLRLLSNSLTTARANGAVVSTLDDGLGNMTVSGTGTFNGALVVNGSGVIIQSSAARPTAQLSLMDYHSGFSSTLAPTTSLTANQTLLMPNQSGTLLVADGSGNATISGNPPSTLGALDVNSSLASSGYIGTLWAPSLTSGQTTSVSVGVTGASARAAQVTFANATLANPLPMGPVVATGGFGSLSLWGGTGGAVYVGSGTTPGVYTQRNVLDDGLGNATFLGTVAGSQLSINNLATSTPTYASILAPNSSASYGLVVGRAATAGASAVISFTGPGVASFGLNGANPLTMDGGGNLVVGGTGTFAQLRTTLGVTLTPSSLPGSTATSIAGDTSGALSILNPTSTNPLQLNPAVPVAAQYFLDTAAGDAVIRVNSSASTLRIGTSGSTTSGLRVMGTTVRTTNSVLDDSNGNLMAAGVVLGSGTAPLAFPAHSVGFGGLSAGSTYAGVSVVNGGGYIQASSTSSTVGPLVLNSAGGSVLTLHNVLDDGSGNMTLNNNSTNSVSMPLQLYQASIPVGGYTQLIVGQANNTNQAGILRFNNVGASTSTNNVSLQVAGGSQYISVAGGGTVKTLNNTLDDGSGNASYMGTLSTSGTLTGGQLAISNPAVNSPPLATILAPSMAVNGNSYGLAVGRALAAGASAVVSLVYSGSTPLASFGLYGAAYGATMDLFGNLSVAATGTFGQLRVLGNGVVSGMLTVAGSTGISLSASGVPSTIASDTFGGLNITNSTSINSLELTPSVGTAGFYFAETVVGDAAIRLNNATGTLRLGTVGGTNSSLRVGGTTVCTLNNVMDDGSGNATVNATGTLNALTLNLSQSSGNCNGWGVYNSTLPVNSTLYNYVGTTGSANNAGYLAFQYFGAGSVFNTIGMGFQGNGVAALRLRANSSVTTQNNTLDDGSGNATLVSSSQSYSTSTGNAGSTMPTFTTSNRITAGIGGGGSNITGVIQTSSSGTVSALPIAMQGSKLVTWNSSGSLVNTLDDGSGNVNVAGYLVARGPLSFPTQLAVGLGTDSGNARGYVQASNGVNTVAPLILNPNGGKLSSQSNTLDDGSGNMTVAGKLNVDGPFQVQKTPAAGDCLILTENSALTAMTVQAYTSGNPFSLQLNPGGGVVSTKNSTLDDGSGNAAFAGKVQFSSGGTATFVGGDNYGALNVTIGSGGSSMSLAPSVPQAGFYFTDTALGDAVIRLTGATGAMLRLGSTPAGGTPSSLRVGATTVKTLNSTLDDGSGNVAINITSPASNALTITQPNLTANTALGIRFGQNLTNSNDSVKMFFNWAGTGSSSNNLQFGFGANGYSQLKVYASNAVTTNYNTLDDGSGNVNVAGYLVARGPLSFPTQLAVGLGTDSGNARATCRRRME